MTLRTQPQKLALACIALFISASAYSQPILIKDLTTGVEHTAGSSPTQVTEFNGTLYFTAWGNNTGMELMKSDGTDAGTVVVKSIGPGAASGPNSSTLIATNNALFFAANDQVHGQELWKSDGTEAGTVVIDLLTGSQGSGPNLLTNVNGTVFFTAHDAFLGRELWKSDGTIAGSVLLKDITPGSATTNIESLIAVNSTLFFVATDEDHGKELWKSDGTEAGTMLVKDINPGPASSVFNNLATADNRLFFVTNDGINGNELWVSDGTDAGTHIVKNIGAGASDSGFPKVVFFNNEIFFINKTPTAIELWKTDGTDGGTTVIRNDFPAHTGTAFSGGLHLTNNKMFFAAGADELWVTDGTAGGSTLLKTFGAGGFLQNFKGAGSLMFMSAVEPATGQELWVSDGTVSGTKLVKDIYPLADNSTPDYLGVVGTKLYFSANDGSHGTELWGTDGTEAGTSLLKDVNTTLNFNSSNLEKVGDQLLFVNSRNPRSYEVWKSDGTASGTVMVKDIAPGLVNANATSYAMLGNKRLMTIDDGTHGYEIWITDGTPAGTLLLKDIESGPNTSPRFLGNVVLNGNLYFAAKHPTHGDGLWRTDGTEAGTEFVTPLDYIGGMLLSGNKIFISTSSGLWVSDGTSSGTVKLNTLNMNSNIYEANGLVYFFAHEGVHGYELWKSDGTVSGTQLVKDVHTESTDHFGTVMGVTNGKVVFIAASTGFNYEPYVTDGTEAGTFMLKDIDPVSFSTPEMIGSTPSYLFFSAYDPDHGRALWRTDGTVAGTILVKDLAAGSLDNYRLVGVDGETLYFSFYDGVDYTLWKTNGTPEATTLAGNFSVGRSVLVDDAFYSLGGNGTSLNALSKLVIKQSITFAALSDKLTTDAPFQIDAFTSANLPVTLSIVSGPATLDNTTLTVNGSGVVTVRATQAGNALVNPATPVERSFAVTKVSQTITFNALTDKLATDAPFVVSGTNSADLPITFSIVSGPATLSNAGNTSATLTLTGSGVVTVRAQQQGNAFYEPALSVERSFTVTKTVQTITFAEIADKNSDDEPFFISASASSSLPVSYEISGPATFAANVVTLTGTPGDVTITASQAGNNFYAAAQSISRTFAVKLITGLEETTTRVTVFPNPASHEVHVDLSDLAGTADVVLLNAMGQQVAKAENGSRAQEVTMDVEHLTTGIYFVKVIQQNQVIVEKISIAR